MIGESRYLPVKDRLHLWPVRARPRAARGTACPLRPILRTCRRTSDRTGRRRRGGVRPGGWSSRAAPAGRPSRSGPSRRPRCRPAGPGPRYGSGGEPGPRRRSGRRRRGGRHRCRSVPRRHAPIAGGHACRAAVHGVAQERVSPVRGVNADLVRASGDGLDGEKGGFGGHGANRVAGRRRNGVALPAPPDQPAVNLHTSVCDFTASSTRDVS